MAGENIPATSWFTKPDYNVNLNGNYHVGFNTDTGPLNIRGEEDGSAARFDKQHGPGYIGQMMTNC